MNSSDALLLKLNLQLSTGSAGFNHDDDTETLSLDIGGGFRDELPERVNSPHKGLADGLIEEGW